jgi:hypothetical protein
LWPPTRDPRTQNGLDDYSADMSKNRHELAGWVGNGVASKSVLRQSLTSICRRYREPQIGNREILGSAGCFNRRIPVRAYGRLRPAPVGFVEPLLQNPRFPSPSTIRIFRCSWWMPAHVKGSRGLQHCLLGRPTPRCPDQTASLDTQLCARAAKRWIGSRPSNDNCHLCQTYAAVRTNLSLSKRQWRSPKPLNWVERRRRNHREVGA